MAGYTRQDTANNISNNSIINADDLDSEYNAIESAFNATTGHTHDGTTGGGSPVLKVGPGQDVIVGTTSVLPKTTATLDIGSSAAKFKNAYLSGTLNSVTNSTTGNSTIGGTLGVTGATGVTTLNASGAVGIDGNLDVGTDKFTVAVATGNTVIAGTLGVTGVALFSNGVTIEGGATLNSAMGVAGTITASSALNVASNITVNTDKFVVEGTTGNTTIAGTLGVTGAITGDLTGNAATATALETARTISLSGDVVGSVSFNGTGNVDIAATIQSNSVALGADTTGDYVASLVAGTGVTLADNTGETATPTISIGQAVATTSDVTFNDLTVSGNLIVSGTTTTVNTETINLADNIITLNSNEAGTPSQNAGIEVERGTSTNKTLVWDEAVDKWTVGSETFVAAIVEAALTGNASTATALQTARTLTLGGDISGSVSFDGSTDVTITATIADDSHNHVIGDVDGLQTEIDTKAELAGDVTQNFSAATLNATTVDLGNWTVTEAAGVLYFATLGVNKMKLDATGNLTVVGNITAYGTI
jgi:hypothetical protein